MNKKYLAIGLLGLGIIDLAGNGFLSFIPFVNTLSNSTEAILQTIIAGYMVAKQ